jgi:hypothetical protein
MDIGHVVRQVAGTLGERQIELIWQELTQPRFQQSANLVLIERKPRTRQPMTGEFYSQLDLCGSPHRGLRRTSSPHSFVVRSLRELAITETELKLMAAAAIIGFSRSPNAGKNTPAASGTPVAL